MKYGLTIILLLASTLHVAAANLHISTWPSSAEIALDKEHNPELLQPLLTPAVIPIDSNHLQDTIQVFLFKAGFQAKSMRVRLAESPNSYVFIHLQAETDSLSLESQNEFLRSRTRHIWGRRMIWSATIPTLVSGFFALQANQYYDEARRAKAKVEGSLFTETVLYQSFQEDYRDNVKLGDQSRTRSLIALAIGGALLGIGGVFYF